MERGYIQRGDKHGKERKDTTYTEKRQTRRGDTYKKGTNTEVSYIGKGLQREKITRRRDVYGKEIYTRKRLHRKETTQKGDCTRRRLYGEGESDYTDMRVSGRSEG